MGADLCFFFERRGNDSIIQKSHWKSFIGKKIFGKDKINLFLLKITETFSLNRQLTWQLHCVKFFKFKYFRRLSPILWSAVQLWFHSVIWWWSFYYFVKAFNWAQYAKSKKVFSFSICYFQSKNDKINFTRLLKIQKIGILPSFTECYQKYCLKKGYSTHFSFLQKQSSEVHVSSQVLWLIGLFSLWCEPRYDT